MSLLDELRRRNVIKVAEQARSETITGCYGNRSIAVLPE
jgi:hypothetical protein